MEPGGRRERRWRQLQGPRQEAAEYYRDHRVPQRMEEALNALFPLRPADLYGELVARGGKAARSRSPRLLLRGVPAAAGPAGRAGPEGAYLGEQGPSRPRVALPEAPVRARRTGPSRSPLPDTGRRPRAPCLPSEKVVVVVGGVICPRGLINQQVDGGNWTSP